MTTATTKSSSGEKFTRRVIEPQMKLGETAIADIKLDPKSPDDIPQILRGLQHIFITPELREAVVDPNTGRPGMTQWQVRAVGAPLVAQRRL